MTITLNASIGALIHTQHRLRHDAPLSNIIILSDGVRICRFPWQTGHSDIHPTWAIEFETQTHNGTIELPAQFWPRKDCLVKVMVLIEANP